MIPLAVIDLISDEWLQARMASARPYGTRPSRILAWWAALRRVTASREPATSVHSTGRQPRPAA